MTLDDLQPGLKHSATITVGEALAVPASSRLLGETADMPPVFATANLIAFVEWTCVAALAPYLDPHQRSVGTRVEMTHTAATPIGMKVAAEIELVEIDGHRLRVKVDVSSQIRVRPSPSLISDIEQVVGAGAVELR